MRYTAGEKVDCVTTDQLGIATTIPLYLGSYEVKETLAGENHVLNCNTFDVTLTYNPNEVQVEERLVVKNERQKAKVASFKSFSLTTQPQSNLPPVHPYFIFYGIYRYLELHCLFYDNCLLSVSFL